MSATTEALEVAESFRFLGRTVEEYRRMFGFSLDELAGQRVLDCPGGPSSFTAVAAGLGVETRTVDPVHGTPVPELETRCREPIGRIVSQLHEKRDLFVWDEYGDVTTRGGISGRPPSVSWPTTRDGQAGIFRRGCRRCRSPRTRSIPSSRGTSSSCTATVSAGRSIWTRCGNSPASRARRCVFPLDSLDAERSQFVDDAVETLRGGGLSVRFEPVPYEFQPGATEALVVRETADVRERGAGVD